MSQINRLLVLLLVAQVVLSGVVFWPRQSVVGSVLVFADQTEAEIVTLSVTDGDGKRLAFEQDGEEWVLPEVDFFPADVDRVSALLMKIEQLRTGRLVTVTEDSHIQLQVDREKFNRRLEIGWSDGSNSTLLIGTSAGAGATHFRLLGEDEVYLTAELTSWDANTAVSNYIDTQFFSVPRDAIVAINLNNQNGNFNFTKIDGIWTWDDIAVGQLLDESALNSLLSQVSEVRMIVPLGKEMKPSYGLERPEATVTITAETDSAVQEHVLRVGSELEDNFVFSASGLEYYITVSSYTASNLIDKGATDFVLAPPEE